MTTDERLMQELENLTNYVGWCERHGRLPSGTSEDSMERKLCYWSQRTREAIKSGQVDPNLGSAVLSRASWLAADKPANEFARQLLNAEGSGELVAAGFNLGTVRNLSEHGIQSINSVLKVFAGVNMSEAFQTGSGNSIDPRVAVETKETLELLGFKEVKTTGFRGWLGGSERGEYNIWKMFDPELSTVQWRLVRYGVLIQQFKAVQLLWKLCRNPDMGKNMRQFGARAAFMYHWMLGHIPEGLDYKQVHGTSLSLMRSPAGRIQAVEYGYDRSVQAILGKNSMSYLVNGDSNGLKSVDEVTFMDDEIRRLVAESGKKKGSSK